VQRFVLMTVTAALVASCNSRPLGSGTASDRSTLTPIFTDTDAGVDADVAEAADAPSEAAASPCDQLARVAEDRVSAAVNAAKAASQCQVAADCDFAPRPACAQSCGAELVPSAGRAAIAATVAAVNADLCQTFADLGCQSPARACLRPPGVVACVLGACTMTGGSYRPLPRAGDDDGDLPTSGR
jgi:hypothetical protein